MEKPQQSLKLRRQINYIKKKKEELDARRKTLNLEQQRIDLERKLLEEESNDIKERIKAIIDAADSPLDADDAASEFLVDEGKGFSSDIDLIKEIIAPAKAIQEYNGGLNGRAAGKLLRYSDMPKKKHIKTLLHTILDLMDERGKMKLKDIAKEVDSDENTLKQWVRVMDRRGMVRVSSSIRGDVFIEKMPYPNP